MPINKLYSRFAQFPNVSPHFQLWPNNSGSGTEGAGGSTTNELRPPPGVTYRILYAANILKAYASPGGSAVTWCRIDIYDGTNTVTKAAASIKQGETFQFPVMAIAENFTITRDNWLRFNNYSTVGGGTITMDNLVVWEVAV